MDLLWLIGRNWRFFTQSPPKEDCGEYPNEYRHLLSLGREIYAEVKPKLEQKYQGKLAVIIPSCFTPDKCNKIYVARPNIDGSPPETLLKELMQRYPNHQRYVRVIGDSQVCDEPLFPYGVVQRQKI